MRSKSRRPSLTVDVHKHFRPRHRCGGCDAYVYGPVPTGSYGVTAYSCDTVECTWRYTTDNAAWPKYSVSFIVR